MNVKPKKYLGQHFLKDVTVAQKIVSVLSENGYDIILEIGPGTGILTKYLVQKKSKITAIELDLESVIFLQQYFNVNISKEKFKIIHGNFLKLSFSKLFKQNQVAIIGNFPYNISTQIIFKAIENRTFVPEFVGMFQKEVAQRITEQKGSKVYGILSVLTQAFFDADYLFTVPPTVFHPQPKVYSGVIRLIRKKKYKLAVNEKLFFKIVKNAFGQRRKMLRGSLKSFKISNTLSENPIFRMRPEQLSVDDFINLTSKIEHDEI